jgi:hypothetical protein
MLVTHDRDLSRNAQRVLSLKGGRLVSDSATSANIKGDTAFEPGP